MKHAFLILLAAALAAGCRTNPGNGEDGGADAADGAGDGGNGDASSNGDADAGPSGDAFVGPCTSNATCAEGKYCEAGECKTGKPCPQGQFDCEDQGAEIDYCIAGGCFCDPADHACKPRYKLCAPCTDSIQCGNDDLYYTDHLADCTAPSAGDGNRYCLQRTGTGSPCAVGYQDKGHGYCEPPTGSCVAGGNCVNESDCNPTSETPVCNFNNGACVPGCVYDVRSGESSCAPGQVCHLDPRLLDPTNPNFARGRCGAPCTPGVTVCPEGTVCAADGPSVNPVNRCRLQPPACVDDFECPDPDGAGPYRGYCDLASKSCREDCRVNDDCNSGFKCVSSACVEMDCVERGGAVLKCNVGEFCCGEAGAPVPCPAGVQVGSCYPAPDPPWCQACQNDASCGDATYDPAKSQALFHKCIEGKCYNGCDPAQPQMCPRSWQCRPLVVACQDSSDCTKCEPSNPNDPQSPKICKCPAGEACPTDTTCKTEIGQCIFGHICQTTACAD